MDGTRAWRILQWGAATASLATLTWWIGRRSALQQHVALHHEDVRRDVTGRAPSEGQNGYKDGEVNLAETLAAEILLLWFGGDIAENYRTKWFCAPGSPLQEEFDALVTTRFSSALEEAVEGRLNGLKKSPRGLLALIILVDQFPRHIYRHAYRPGVPRSERIAKMDALALALAEEMRDKGWAQELSVAQQIFALMPLRHSPSLDRLKSVLAEIDARAEAEDQARDLLTRFRKTTLRRMQGLEGQVEEDAEILEHMSFVADESDLEKQGAARSMHSFLHDYVEGKGLQALAVSLSGGVDSMVIAKCLVHYKQRFGYEVVALHLDYANRAESGREADFVEAWCRQMGIIFRKRVVGEVTRGVTARDEYEKVSREIRFAFYQEVLAEFACPAVMFGHHQGDLQENVISNVMRGCGPLQLSGMARDSVINQVTVWRPLLDLTKDVILDFAHRYGVPYFKDTTPTWSTRGKLRRHLVPLLADMYGEGFKANLSSLANQSDELRDVVNATLLDPFLNSIQRAVLASHVDVALYKHQSIFFWREVLRTLAHSMGQGKLTDKGVGKLQRHINERPFSSREFWFELRKDYAVLLLHSRLFFFRPGVIVPSSGSTAYPPHGLVIPLEQPTMVGPWRVQPTLCVPEDISAEELCKRPVFPDVAVFCKGTFEYHLRLIRCRVCGAYPLLLVMREGYKGLTPWQQVELRVKRSLPVVVPLCQTCDGAHLPAPSEQQGAPPEPLQSGGSGRMDSVPIVRISYSYAGYDLEL